MCFPEGGLIDGQTQRGPVLLRRTHSTAVLDLSLRRAGAATRVRRKDKSSDGPAFCPWASWELQPKSSSEKAVATPAPTRASAPSDFRLCPPNRDIPITHTMAGCPASEAWGGRKWALRRREGRDRTCRQLMVWRGHRERREMWRFMQNRQYWETCS